jgi:hypothetical protein
MASEQGALPCICLDPSRRLISLIDLQRVRDGVPHDWCGLFNKAIQHQHLCPLVSSVGLVRDRHKLVPHVRNHVKWRREFVCPTCAQFRLIFRCSKPQKGFTTDCWLLEHQEPEHSAECPACSCVDEASILAILPSLIRQMRHVELEPQSAGKTFGMVDVESNSQMQQLSTSLHKSSIHRTLEPTRAKCRLEVREFQIAPFGSGRQRD